MLGASGLLKHARRSAHLTQRQLAGLAGIDQAVIARIEAGTSSPRFDTLSRLLRATGHQVVLARAPQTDAARIGIRHLLAMTDVDRERYFIESNANMLRMFREARPR